MNLSSSELKSRSLPQINAPRRGFPLLISGLRQTFSLLIY
jgi:hypothetical protein